MIEGSLSEFNFGEILTLAGKNRKTGVIILKSPDGREGKVYLRDGYIYFAESNQKRKQIGEMLVDAGKLTRNQLQAALEEQKKLKNKVRLGMILIDMGFISPQDLVQAVQEQITETIFQFFEWNEGSFVFIPGVEALNEDIGIKMDIETAILKGSERIKHWKSLKRFIDNLDVVFEPNDISENNRVIVLRPKELKILRLIDGKKSVRELLKETGFNEFELLKLLFGLYSAKLIRKKGETN